ncbi:MAG: hypothetical protein KAU14_04965 [Thermoplasmata archaeon]|nr:hypothetical protein [Thermoplasmata archaeon]
MSFEIILGSGAFRFLKSVKKDRDIYSRLIEKIKKLVDDPIPSDAKRVVGRKEKVFRAV